MSIETVEYRNHKINISQDECPGNPCNDWEQMGVMWCEHSRYDLGHNKAQATLLNYCYLHDPVFMRLCDSREVEKADIVKSLKKLNCVILPLYLLDHSGLSMSTSAFSYPWDSGAVGLMVATPQTIRECFGIKNITKKRRAQVIKSLIAQAEEYDNYLTGNVYGFDIVDAAGVGDIVGSCYGFYGHNHAKSGLLETARAEIDAIDRQLPLEFAV